MQERRRLKHAQITHALQVSCECQIESLTRISSLVKVFLFFLYFHKLST